MPEHLDSDDSDAETSPAPRPTITDLDAIPDGPSFHLVTMVDGSKFHRFSPFKIHRWIKSHVSETQVDHAKPLRSGALLVKVLDRTTAIILHGLSDFLGMAITVRAADRMNTVEALAHAPSLTTVDEQEILEELQPQGVVGVQRLRPRQGRPSPLLRLKFAGHSYPSSIRAGFEVIELRLWVRPPLLCRKCARYGHGSRACRAKTARCLKCAGPHHTDSCEAAHRHCPQCEGPHAAWEHAYSLWTGPLKKSRKAEERRRRPGRQEAKRRRPGRQEAKAGKRPNTRRHGTDRSRQTTGRGGTDTR